MQINITDLRFNSIMGLLHFFHHLVTVAAEVTTGGSAVFFPWLQANPAEIMLTLFTNQSTSQLVNQSGS